MEHAHVHVAPIQVEISADADEPPASTKTQHSILYSGNTAELRAFLKSIGQTDFYHPAIEVRESKIAGRGVFATSLIKKGELISYEDPRDYVVLNMEQVEARSQEDQDFFWHFCYQVGDALWFGPKDHVVVDRKRTFFTNHSCDPTTWFVDDITMTARRDIHPGEEITYDYSTTESWIDPEMETVVCRCCSPLCRGRLYPTDWQRPELHERYGPHWMSYLVEKIAVFRTAQNRPVVIAEKDVVLDVVGDSMSLDLSETASTSSGSSEPANDTPPPSPRLSSSCGRSLSLSALAALGESELPWIGAHEKANSAGLLSTSVDL